MGIDILEKAEMLLATTFDMDGRQITYGDFTDSLEKVKAYVESSHKDRILYRDPTGQLWLYEFDEYMDFDGTSDVMNEVYCMVSGEEEADKLSVQSLMFWKAKPHIHVDDQMVLHTYLGRSADGH